MEFTNKAPEWNAEGAKPTEDLINQGFTAGYKPPADYFNYMFNQYKKSIDETQEAVNTLDDNLSNYVTKENPTLYSATSKGTSIKVKNSEGDTCPLHLNGNGVYADEEGYAFYAEEFYEAGKKLDKIYATKDELATVETTMTDEYAKKYNTRLTGTTYIDDGIVAAEEETDMEGESVYTQKDLWLNGGVLVSADGQELDAEVLKQSGVKLDDILADYVEKSSPLVNGGIRAVTTDGDYKALKLNGMVEVAADGSSLDAPVLKEAGTKLVDKYATKTEFNNLAVGGTNLLINTTTFEGYENICNITTEHFLGHNVWKYTIPSTLTSFLTILGKSNIKIETDEYYTLSFYAKGTGHIYTYFFRPSGSLVESGYNNIGSTARVGDGAIGIDLTNEWKRYITTWKVHKSSTLSLSTKEVSADLLIARFESGQVAGNNISICGVKLEKGNKATDWSPAPEDIATTYAPLDSPAFTTAVSMGRKSGTTVGIKSIAIGNVVTASGSSSQAFGQGTVASGNYSHAEGDSTTASGFWAHAEGSHTTASGNYAHAEGYYTTALQNQHAQGHYNSTSLATANSDSGTSTGTAFVIGNGTSSTASNAFRVTGKGATYAKEAYNATGADYAEYAEWADGNPNNEDRRGYFVTFDEDKPAMIRKANEGDWVLGVVSGNPCIIGNSDECWRGQYVYDEFGGIVYEDVEETYTDEETGEEKTRIINQYKLNPEYDASKEYIHRENRQEWDAVGWIGVLSVRDDGTCTPAGYCKVADGGTATAAERGIDTYRVLERVSENIVKIVVK